MSVESMSRREGQSRMDSLHLGQKTSFAKQALTAIKSSEMEKVETNGGLNIM